MVSSLQLNSNILTLLCVSYCNSVNYILAMLFKIYAECLVNPTRARMGLSLTTGPRTTALAA